MHAVLQVPVDTFSAWSRDNASRLAASLSFYTVLSLAPILIIVIAVLGLALGEQAAQGQLVTQVRGIVGDDGANAIQSIIQNAGQPAAGIAPTIIGVILLVFGASGVFAELQSSLDDIWEVQRRPGHGVLDTLRSRFLSFSMVLGIGFLLLVSLVVSAGVAVLTNALHVFGGGLAFLAQASTFVVFFGVATVLFALIYRVLPEAVVAWRDVWLGAAVTSFLFSIGKLAIGLYLGSSGVTSAYGAAGSLVALLVWVYYSAQILFLGAEFTKVWALRQGRPIRPSMRSIRALHAPPAEPAAAPRG